MKSLFSIFKINLLKTVLFNFKYLPVKVAFKFPIYVYNRTHIQNFKGEIIIACPHIKRGMIKIGKQAAGICDNGSNRTIWDVKGRIVFEGECFFGSGTRISVGAFGSLILGSNLIITGDSSLVCFKQIKIGNNSLLSWDILIMDTDFHSIYNEKGEIVNKDMPIEIGNNVWIGCRNTVLKGTIITDNNIIAANSLLTKQFLSEGNIIGGINEIITSKVTWKP